MTLEKLTTAYLKRERLLAANEVGKFHDLLVHELFCSRDANSISNTVGNADARSFLASSRSSTGVANRPRTHEQAARTANTIQPSQPSPYARASLHSPPTSRCPRTNRPHTHGQAEAERAGAGADGPTVPIRTGKPRGVNIWLQTSGPTVPIRTGKPLRND